LSAETKEQGATRGAGERLPYEKPALEFVEIHADQVLVDVCKAFDTAVGSVGGAPGCATRGCYASNNS
jgi:hypothetical protein